VARTRSITLGAFLWALGFSLTASAQPQGLGAGAGEDLINFAQSLLTRTNISTTLALVFLVTLLSLAPSILVLTTCFTRIIVVFGFLRQALGTQQTPPNQVLIGLALFLTVFIMAPTYRQVNEQALQPYLRGELQPREALETAVKPIREFMFRQTRPRDLRLFLEIGKYPRPNTPDDVPTHVLIPAFVLSELTLAFQIGFLLYVPFLIIDMVVASTLMAMGMMMLPPIVISLPFKIILFILADGWGLLVGSLVRSVR